MTLNEFAQMCAAALTIGGLAYAWWIGRKLQKVIYNDLHHRLIAKGEKKECAVKKSLQH